MKKLAIFGVVLLSVILIGFYTSDFVSADVSNHELAIEPAQDHDRCAAERIDIMQADGITQIDACVEYGNDFSLAYSSAYGGSFEYIRIGEVDSYARLNFTYEGAIALGDDMIYSSSTSPVGLFRIKNVSSSLRAVSFKDGRPKEYGVNWTATPEEIIPYSENESRVRPVGSYKVSSDHRYLFAYMDNQVFVKYDLEAGVATVVFAYQHKIYQYSKWTSIAGISDDGRYIFVGNGGGLIDTSQCGASIGQWDSQYTSVLRDTCTLQDMSSEIADVVGHWFVHYNIDVANFVDDHKIKFHATSTDGPITGGEYKKHWFMLSLSTLQLEHRIEYLALGDSYSSGEGDVGNDGFWYRKGTEKDRQCHLSIRAYPYLLRDTWGIARSEMASVACSGALLGHDYSTSQDLYNGQHGEIKGISEQERDATRNNAIENYLPGVIPQLEFVKKYKPKVVTVTAGGNDVGFADILQYCASDFFETLAYNYSCEYIKGGILNQLLSDSIDTQYVKIVRLIGEIKEASPGVNVYYIGYPSFIGRSNTSCFMSNVGVLDGNEREMINDAIQRLNNVIRKAAGAAGAEYVDIENALNGGRLCEGSEYVTGIWAAGVANVLQGNAQEAFHPNAKGNEKIRDAIISRVADPLTDYQPTTPDVVTVSPTTLTSRARIVRDPDLNGEEMMEISLEPNSTPGSSDIIAAEFSERIELGQYKSNDDGSLDVRVRVPESLPNGTHLVLLDVYQDGKLLNRMYDFVTVNRSVVEGESAVPARIEPAISMKSGNTNDKTFGMNESVGQPVLSKKAPDTEPLLANEVRATSRDNGHGKDTLPVLISCILSLCVIIACVKVWQNR